MTNDNIIRLKTVKILVTDEEVDRDKLGSTDEADGLPTQVLTHDQYEQVCASAREAGQSVEVFLRGVLLRAIRVVPPPSFPVMSAKPHSRPPVTRGGHSESPRSALQRAPIHPLCRNLQMRQDGRGDVDG
jgi:hypothetical protein